MKIYGMCLVRVMFFNVFDIYKAKHFILVKDEQTLIMQSHIGRFNSVLEELKLYED